MDFIKKVREWPKEGGGTLTFAQFIREEELDRLKEQILALIKEGESIGLAKEEIAKLIQT